MEPNHKEGRYDFADKSMCILFLTTQVQLKNKDIKKVRVFTEYTQSCNIRRLATAIYYVHTYSPQLYFLAKKTCKKMFIPAVLLYLLRVYTIYAELSTFFKAKQTCNASGIPLLNLHHCIPSSELSLKKLALFWRECLFWG